MLEITCPDCLSSNLLEDREVSRDIECFNCGATFLVEPIIDEIVEEKVEEKVENDKTYSKQVSPQNESAFSKVIITNGPPPFDYEIIEPIFVIDTINKKVFSNANPSHLFDGAKMQLKSRAWELGGDAIIHCHFDYRISTGHGIFGASQDLEIFAYGTLVKRT